MKRIILIFVAALIAAACAAPSTNQQVTPANSNTAATKPAATITEADAMAKEKEIWAAFEKKDYASFTAMLADDLINVAPEAVYNKVESVKSVSGFVPSDVTFADWKFLPVDKDTGVIVYSVKFKGTVNGEPATAVRLLEHRMGQSSGQVARGLPPGHRDADDSSATSSE